MPPHWTSEKIAEKSSSEIKALRENAINHRAHEVVALCDIELSKRAEAQRKVPRISSRQKSPNEPVIGYHFVCRPREKGVVRNTDGSVWSGTWVVAEAQAKRSLKCGAYVALHLSHAEPSYLQGIIKGVRRSRRAAEYAVGEKVKTPIGTDFLLDITDERLDWKGEGTVEKRYVYAPLASEHSEA